jgi:membrane protein
MQMIRAPALVKLLRSLPALGSFAAEMAFYLALSLVPFLGLTAVAAVTWLPAKVGEPLADTLIRVFAPEAGLDPAAIASWVGSIHSSGWLAAGVLLAAWGSFRFMAACVRALASLGGGDPQDLRHRLRSIASALFLVFVWMLALLLLSFVILVAPALEETLGNDVLLGRDAPTATVLSRAMAAIVLLLAIALTYRAIPGLRARGWRLWLMAALATGGWVAAGWTVTRLLPSLWGAQALYGALGSFLLFLLWFYVDAWVLLVCGRLSTSSPRLAGAQGASR